MDWEADDELLEVTLMLGGKPVLTHVDRNGPGMRTLDYTLLQQNIQGASESSPVTVSILRELRTGQVLGDEIFTSKPAIKDMQFPLLFESAVRGITFTSLGRTLKMALAPPQ
jgi:hypothetical protein